MPFVQYPRTYYIFPIFNVLQPFQSKMHSPESFTSKYIRVNFQKGGICNWLIITETGKWHWVVNKSLCSDYSWNTRRDIFLFKFKVITLSNLLHMGLYKQISAYRAKYSDLHLSRKAEKPLQKENSFVLIFIEHIL